MGGFVRRLGLRRAERRDGDGGFGGSDERAFGLGCMVGTRRLLFDGF